MISLNIVVDFCPPERLDRALLYLKRTKQKSVVIAGGTQLDLTMQYIERVRRELPDIMIQFRLLEDTGIVMKLTTSEWFNRYVVPRYKWLKDNRILIVVDNETSGDDAAIRKYVENCKAIAGLLHGVGLNGVFCRFATGNIQESQYILLKPLLDALNSGDWIGPNEYSNVPGKSSGGHLERFKRIEAVTTKPLNMSIGEAGILVDYKARAGYREAAMSGRDMAAQMIAEEIWYRGGTITRHAFCIGGNTDWQSLQIGDDALEFWEEYYSKIPIPDPIVIPSPTPNPTVVVSKATLLGLKSLLATSIDAVQKSIVQLAQADKSLHEQMTSLNALIDQAK